MFSLSSTETAGQLDVLGHHGDTAGVDGAEVGILQDFDGEGLGLLLEGHYSRGLEAKGHHVALGDLLDQSLEWQLAQQELRALLVATDLTEGHGSRTIAVGLLECSCGMS